MIVVELIFVCKKLHATFSVIVIAKLLDSVLLRMILLKFLGIVFKL